MSIVRPHMGHEGLLGTLAAEGGTPHEGPAKMPGGAADTYPALPTSPLWEGMRVAAEKIVGNGLLDSHDAPSLAEPAIAFSANELLSVLQQIQIKSQNVRLQTDLNGLEAIRRAVGKNTEAQLKQREEWVRKCQDADEKNNRSRVMGWIVRISGVILAGVGVALAVVATVATGGAAAPLLFVASVALVSALMALADQISSANGGPQISISNLLMTVFSNIFENFGVPHDDAQRIGKVLAGVTALAIPVLILIEPKLCGVLAGGIATLAGASPRTAASIELSVGAATSLAVMVLMCVVTMGASSAALANTVNSFTVAASQLVGGAVNVAEGSINISTANSQYDAEAAIAGQKRLESDMGGLQKLMEEHCEDVRKIFQEIGYCSRAISEILREATNGMMQVATNIARKKAV